MTSSEGRRGHTHPYGRKRSLKLFTLNWPTQPFTTPWELFLRGYCYHPVKHTINAPKTHLIRRETSMPQTNHYDVIIIGTGAGGGTLAYALAPSGKRVLVLERGDYVRR